MEDEILNSINGQEAFDQVRDYILGKDWYVVDPIQLVKSIL